MKKIILTEKDLTRIIQKIINEEVNPGGYDEFLEEMLSIGQSFQTKVEAIRRGNPNEMASYDIETPEKASASFKALAALTIQKVEAYVDEMKSLQRNN